MAITWTEENSHQELVHAGTHGLGFLLSIPAGLVVIWAGAVHSVPMFLACSVYALTSWTMYLFSSLSHAIREPALRHHVRALDQGFVYTFIAGTITPLVASFLSGWLCVSMLVVVWAAALSGFYSKVLSNHRVNNMASLTYLLLGWLPSMVLAFYVPLGCFAWMVAGGLLYSCGVWFLQNDHRGYYHHATWHIAVILGSVCHYLAILLYAV
jgi:hemolysin III